MIYIKEPRNFCENHIGGNFPPVQGPRQRSRLVDPRLSLRKTEPCSGRGTFWQAVFSDLLLNADPVPGPHDGRIDWNGARACAFAKSGD